MFLAASLNPDYFNEKVNLFVALGPVTSLVNIEVPALRWLSNDWREVEYLALKFGAYDLMNFGWEKRLQHNSSAMQLALFVPTCSNTLLTRTQISTIWTGTMSS